MKHQNDLGFTEGEIVSIPFFENEKFVVGATRSGGMGSIYQLLPLLPSHPAWALKTYQGNIDSMQFDREARIWISLGTHLNIAQAIVFGTLKHTHCILATWYPRNMLDLNPRKMTIQEICNFVAGIISGLKFGDEKLNLIHKDIKPLNILVDGNNVPKIADFGISSYVPDKEMNCNFIPSGSQLTPDEFELGGKVSGTPMYMAPELFSGGHNSIQTDIFALGVTLFEWLTGKHPYISDTGEFDGSQLDTFFGYMGDAYGSEIAPLVNLVLLALHCDPNLRPVSYKDLINRSSFYNILLEETSKVSVADMISTAQVLRKQGRVDEAALLLKRNLDNNPTDALLLNAYATLLINLGDQTNALVYLDQSILVLRENNGKYLGQPFFEPHLNLALLYLGSNYFDQAAAILHEALANLGPTYKEITYMFWEFGWLMLYEGQIDEAIKRFVYYLSRKNAIEPVVGMFCLAASMTSNKSEYFRRCFDLISAQGCEDVAICQYLCVMGSYFDIARLHRLNTQVLTQGMIVSLEKMSIAISGDVNYFKMPMADEMVRRVLLRVDSKYTGGKYGGIF